MDNAAEKKIRRCTDEANLARQEEILETATELFAEHGFSDAITQALADRLGVGKGTIYRHFPSKRALFLAAADRVMHKLQEAICEQVTGITDGLVRRGAGDQHVPQVLRRSSFVRRAPDPGAGLFQGSQAADLLRAPSGQYFALATALPRDDRRRPHPGYSRRANHECGQQCHVRNHGDQFLQRRDQAAGSPGQGNP